MHILQCAVKKGGGCFGVISCRPETCDDLWILYNVLFQGDRLSSFTQRKVSRNSEKGASSSHKEGTFVTLDIDKTEFYADEAVLRVSGKVSKINKTIQLGRFHTVSVKIGTSVKIEKDYWDEFAYRKLMDAATLRDGIEFLVLLIDLGICSIFLVSDVVVRRWAFIEQHIPKKHSMHTEHERSKETFFKNVLRSLLQYDRLCEVTCVVFAGPGFIKEDFLNWIKTSSSKNQTNPSIKALHSAFLCTATTPHRHSLEEVLCSNSLREQCTRLAAWKHIQALDAFKYMLHHSPTRAVYGPTHVIYAIDQKAVETLIISSTLFRSFDTSIRLKYNAAVDKAKHYGASVHVVPDSHCGGKELQGLGGIVAILRYGLPELEESEFDHRSD